MEFFGVLLIIVVIWLAIAYGSPNSKNQRISRLEEEVKELQKEQEALKQEKNRQ